MEKEKCGGAGEEEEQSCGGTERHGAGGEGGEGEASLGGLGDPERAQKPGEQRQQIDGDEGAQSEHGRGGAAKRDRLPLLSGAMPDGGGGGELRDLYGGVDAGGVLEEECGGLPRVVGMRCRSRGGRAGRGRGSRRAGRGGERPRGGRGE